MDSLMSKAMPFEQVRWNQANIDTLFWAGEQSFVNSHFNYTPGWNYQNYYFNIIQQPINLVTGYQRQNRKAISFTSIQNSDPQTTDQYTKLIINSANENGIYEDFSRSCELSAVAGMNLIQPYLDFVNGDPAQGDLRLNIWEYNSFIVDPFFRKADMSDANYFWCQEYISKQEAKEKFGDKIMNVRTMGTGQKYSNFYFLPESSTMTQSNMYVLSYIWYKSMRKKKRLYSKTWNQFFDFNEREANQDAILQAIPDLELVTVTVPSWKCCVVLNDQLMYQGFNPTGSDRCPVIPNFWNYDPHINQPAFRDRSLVRPMRTPQFLYNYKIITNNDIASSTINSGYKRKSGAVANEDNLKKAGQGYDIIINEGYEMTDVEKIIPSAVPESDLALAQQMADLVTQVSGINIENWSGQGDKQISALTAMIKQAANLMVFQKYFDQWDYCLKQVGEICLEIALNNWSPEKVGILIGEEPSPFFYSKIFAKYKTVVGESDLTATQQNLQAQQMFEINEKFGREVIPPSMILPKLNIQGKAEIIEMLKAQEQQQAAMQEHTQMLEQAFTEAKLKDLNTKALSQLAQARERHGRMESNIGLFEERLSEVQKNQSLSTKAKMEAIEKMVDVIAKFGEVETMLAEKKVDQYNNQTDMEQNLDTQRAKASAMGNQFMAEMLGGGAMQGGDMGQQQQMQQPQQMTPPINM